ncbi:MAG: glycosyltransferase [Proteobacteria bacterium]|nr:glycosyltransferase [Pseudomonadota bacterium]
MRFSIITPNYNGAAFLEETIRSVLQQREMGVEIEYIIIDGGSTDHSHAIIENYRSEISSLVIEKDTGPANAINKGFALASGDIIAWLNADDLYFPGTLQRVREMFELQEGLALCFGRCPIIDENGVEIRPFITRFKEGFFPLSSQYTFQCINYISQPALFFSREAMVRAGKLREDMVAAWDYEFMLKLWHFGRGAVIPGGPIAAFRWHDQSISGQNYKIQFKEELDAVIAELGGWKLQVLLHHGVRWGIVGAYNAMANVRKYKHKFGGYS